MTPAPCYWNDAVARLHWNKSLIVRERDMKRHYAVIGLIITATLGLAACTGDDGIASITDSGDNAVSDDKALAEAMVDCLREAGIPAATEVLDPDQDTSRLVIETDEPYALAYADGSATWMPGDGSDAQAQSALARLEELTAKYVPTEAGPSASESGDPSETDAPSQYQPYLVIGETDHTAVFTQCLTQTGYVEQVWRGETQAEELERKMPIAESGTRWAACARENGYPQVKDPDPPVPDGWVTMPLVVLPGTITATDLRALLAQCPNFDLEAAEAIVEELLALPASASEDEQRELLRSYTDLSAHSPSISFDIPGWDYEDYDGPETDENYIRGADLRAVLREAENAFDEQAQKRLEEIFDRLSG